MINSWEGGIFQKLINKPPLLIRQLIEKLNLSKCQNSYATSERVWFQYSTVGCYHFSLVAPSVAVCFNTPQWSPFFLLSSLFSGLFNNMSSGPSKSWFSFFSITNTNGSKSFQESHFLQTLVKSFGVLKTSDRQHWFCKVTLIEKTLLIANRPPNWFDFWFFRRW